MEEEKDFTGRNSLGIVKILLVTFKRRMSLAFLHCVSKVDQFSCCNNSVMLSWSFLFHAWST